MDDLLGFLGWFALSTIILGMLVSIIIGVPVIILVKIKEWIDSWK